MYISNLRRHCKGAIGQKTLFVEVDVGIRASQCEAFFEPDKRQQERQKKKDKTTTEIAKKLSIVQIRIIIC